MAHRDPLTAALARVEALESDLADLRSQRGQSDADLVETIRGLREQLRSATEANERAEIARSVAEAALALARNEREAERAKDAAQRELESAERAMQTQLTALRHDQQMEIARAGRAFAEEEIRVLREELAVLRTGDVAKIRGYYQSRREAVLHAIAGLAARRGELAEMQGAIEAAERTPPPDDTEQREIRKNRIAADRAVLEAKRAALADEEPYLAERLRFFDERLAAITR